jgi:hypothetical protein
MMQPLWKTAGLFLKKLNIELPPDPATPFLGLLKGSEIFWIYQKEVAVLFTIATRWKWTQGVH